ncbi:MAG: glycosyltransferase, partial [Lentisphaeria bacterium]|nr:glycosyltransferase [Lentisphaeria bacterium]
LQLVLPAFMARGIGVDVIAMGRRPEPGFQEDLEHYRSHGARVTTLPISHAALLPGGGAVRACRALLREWDARILHCHSTVAGLIGRRAAQALPNLRTVYAPHAFRFLAYPSGIRRWVALSLERWLLGATDALVAVSQSERQTMLTQLHADPERITLAENALPSAFPPKCEDAEAVRAQWGVPPGCLLIGLAGRLCRQKGQDILLHALAQLDQTFPEYRVVFCGDGPWEPRLRSLAGKLGIADRILWPGHDPHLPAKLPAFDVAAAPSRYEALSYTLLEILCQGVPLIASDIPANLPRESLRDVIRMFPAGDAQALASALAEFAIGQEKAQEAARRGECIARAEFRLEHQVETLATLYKTLSSTSTSRPAEHS